MQQPIREVEATCADCTHTLQQLHSNSMQGLEGEVIEKGRDCQSFLTACGVPLQACPTEAHGILMYPLQLLMGNMSLATSLGHLPQASTAIEKPTPATPHPTMLAAPAPISEIKWLCHPSGEEATEPNTPAKEPTHQKQKEGKLLVGLKENCWEAFCQDTDLVQGCPGRHIFEMQHSAFDQEGSQDISNLFLEMITSTNLLESKIYEVQEVWAGQRDLMYAHCAMEMFTWGSPIFLAGFPFRVTKGYGSKRNSSS